MPNHHYLCPRCGLLLGADRDLTGRRVQCRGCQMVFTAGVTPAAPAPRTDPDRTSAASPAPARPSPGAPRPAKRGVLLPYALGGAVMALAGLTLGIAALTTAGRPNPAPEAVAHAPVVSAVDPARPEEPPPPPSDVLPVSSEVTLFVRPEPGQELEEDVPAGIAGRPPAAPGPAPTLPPPRVSDPGPPARPAADPRASPA